MIISLFIDDFFSKIGIIGQEVSLFVIDYLFIFITFITSIRIENLGV
jgi:hypothetical protein